MPDFIQRPLPESLRDAEEFIKGQLAKLAEEYRLAAEPWVRKLAELEAHRPPPMMVLSAEEARRLNPNILDRIVGEDQ